MELNFEKHFDSHELFNKWQSLHGMRPSTGGTKPSVYISEVKLKKAFNLIRDEYIEDLFDKEMGKVEIKIHREKLVDKLESLHSWQLFTAVEILITDGMGAFQAADFVLGCKSTDTQPEK
jgi:hypothetical protein